MMWGFFKRTNKTDDGSQAKEKNSFNKDVISRKQSKNMANKKLSAAAFVDYEHWYYGYNNLFKLKPNVMEWYNEINEEFDVRTVKIFGDFSEKNLKKDIERLEKITNDIVHTASMKDGVDKDFTDVIILDAIYREAAKPDSPDVFIIFTGDGHFDVVIKYLRELKKKVYVYGVRHSFSSRLRSSANAYVEMPRNEQELAVYFDMILTSLKILSKKGKTATYRKTIANVSEYQNIPSDRIQSALDYLIKNRYIIEEQVRYKGKPTKILSVLWDKIKEDGIWKTEKVY